VVNSESGDVSRKASLESFFDAAIKTIGAEWIDRSEATIASHSEHTLPGEPIAPGGVVAPGSVDEVQVLVRLANDFDIPLWPISNGMNVSLGSRAPISVGQVVVDLGRRMNRILSIDEELGVVTLEPGVSYRSLRDELGRRGDKFMIDPTSGPPEGSVIGNALDKGAGYTPYADHFGMTCGLEIVLGGGEILRTGDAILPKAAKQHLFKNPYGPLLDGLFVQANYGIVTSVGLWLMPRPPAIRSFFFSFPDDGDLGEITDLVRPLKLSGFVPTMLRVTNDMWLIASEEKHPEYTRTRSMVSDACRFELQKKHGIGAWVVGGAFYGASFAALQPQIDRVRAHFARSAKARYISHEEALENPGLKASIDAFSGEPSVHELKQLQWRPGGGVSVFTPGIPLDGALAAKCSELSRNILTKHGLEYLAMSVCGTRFARGLHQIVWNKMDPDEDACADAAYVALVKAYADLGLQSGRSPTRYHKLHMSLLDPIFRDTCSRLKALLDPKHVIAPGRYGIHSTNDGNRFLGA
jgi:4-cresol dehydrogenase (hydroxylating) flavoprotein subunit